MKKIIVNIKTWWFNKEFERYYRGLLLGGDLSDPKVILLSDMRKNKASYLFTYLTKGTSVGKMIESRIDLIEAHLIKSK